MPNEGEGELLVAVDDVLAADADEREAERREGEVDRVIAILHLSTWCE